MIILLDSYVASQKCCRTLTLIVSISEACLPCTFISAQDRLHLQRHVRSIMEVKWELGWEELCNKIASVELDGFHLPVRQQRICPGLQG